MANIGSNEAQRLSAENRKAAFELSARHASDLARYGFGTSLAAGATFVAAFAANLFSTDAIWLSFFCANAAALLIFLAALRSSYEVAEWRRKQAGLSKLSAGKGAQFLRALAASPWSQSQDEQEPDWIERLTSRLVIAGRAGAVRVGPRALRAAGVAFLACLVVYIGWPAYGANPAPARSAAYLCMALYFAFAFALLVTERQLAGIGHAEWPEAALVSRFARLPIFVILTSSFGLFLGTAGSASSRFLFICLLAWLLLIALELLLRALAAMFSPQGEDREPSIIAESIIVGGLFQWPPRPLARFGDELEKRHGIDLRSIWAVSFIRTAAPPIILSTAALAWGLTGVREIPINGRGIYERFGRFDTVLAPGLHIGLPWPFGRIISVENGDVHELATAISADDNPSALPAAEAAPPDSANRLWDRTHTSEKSQVIAGVDGGFQIVNMDVRIVYRIGMSDDAAVKAAYQVSDLPSLIKSTANRVLVHNFAKRTLDAVLSQNRLSLGPDIASEVQKSLDDLNSGVEILAVVVEAIHPPAGASDAFHGVQAAQISAEALVARQRGAAAEEKNEAQLDASLRIDAASAQAREETAAAEVSRIRFGADRSAFADAGQTFLKEEYFRQLAAGLSTSKILVLDHRLGGPLAPTLDLRSMMLPLDPEPKADPTLPSPRERPGQ